MLLTGFAAGLIVLMSYCLGQSLFDNQALKSGNNTCFVVRFRAMDLNFTEDCAVKSSFVINQYAVSGEVSSLQGTGLTLDLNGIETLAISADGLLTFITELDHDSDYPVTVTEQPNDPSQSCTVANASGTINAADVTDIEITCSTEYNSHFHIISDAPSSPDQVQLSGHSFSAIPVPINRSAMLVILALVLLMGGWSRWGRGRLDGADPNQYVGRQAATRRKTREKK